MSFYLSAHNLKKIPSIKEFKEFIKEKVKDNLKEDCHNLKFKRGGKKCLLVGYKGQGLRGCWFFFWDNILYSIIFGRGNGAVIALQDLVISELVKQYGGKVVNDNDDFSASWTFNRKTGKWDKSEIEYNDPTE